MNTYVQDGLAALGDPTIFVLLARRPYAVNELAVGLPVSRPAVSQHLKVLKTARLVRDRQEGTRGIYEMNPVGIRALRDHFAQLWDQALSSFKNVAEEEYQKEKEHGARNGSKHGGKKNPSRASAD